MERMIGRQKRLLPMQDRRVGTGGIIEAVDLAGAKRKLDAAEQGRVRIGLEIGINEVRNLARLPVQLDQVGPVERSQVSPGTSLVNSQERIEYVERGAVDVQSGRQQLAHGRPTAGFVDGLGAPGPEEPVVFHLTHLAGGPLTVCAFVVVAQRLSLSRHGPDRSWSIPPAHETVRANLRWLPRSIAR
jgi:hypothetical protein